MSRETIVLADSGGSTQARIMPALGMNCYGFRVALAGQPVEVLWADPDFAGGEKRPTRSGIPILFPFAGRIGGAKYQYAGREYQLTPSDPLGSAIHGFVVHRPWRVVGQTADSVTGEFQAAVDDPALLEHWPADFRLRVTYRVAPGTLRGECTIENPDHRPLPCGIGFHGYYRLPLGPEPSAAECRVQVPVGQRWELADMLPTGHRGPSAAGEQLTAGVPFGQTQLDDVFDAAFDAAGICTTSVVDPRNHRTLTMRFGELFRTCVVFNPPHREAICVEPYTTVPDGFALAARGIDPHLLTIAPGGSLGSWFDICLSAG